MRESYTLFIMPKPSTSRTAAPRKRGRGTLKSSRGKSRLDRRLESFADDRRPQSAVDEPPSDAELGEDDDIDDADPYENTYE